MRTRWAAIVAAIAVIAGGVGELVAQEGTATPGSGEVGVARVFSTVVEETLLEPVLVQMSRISFEPGAGLSMTANPGPALHYVEEGGFTVQMAGDGTLASGDGAATPVAAGAEFEIGPGDLLTIPANTPFEVFNTGTAPAVAIIVEYFWRPSGAALPPGIVLKPLSVQVLSPPPAGPVGLQLNRVTVPPGGEVAVDGGRDVVGIEEGSGGYAVVAGGRRNAGDGALVLLILAHRPMGEDGTPVA